MRLYEFADDDPLRVKLTGVVTQLKEKGHQDPISIDELLAILSHYGITLDKTDIYDLIKKDPLVNIISAIEGDKVIFKGDEPEPSEQGPDENEKIRQQLASKQATKTNPLA